MGLELFYCSLQIRAGEKLSKKNLLQFFSGFFAVASSQARLKSKELAFSDLKVSMEACVGDMNMNFFLR